MAQLHWMKDSKYNEYSAPCYGAVYQITPGDADDEWYVAVKAGRTLERLHDGPVHGLYNAKKIASLHKHKYFGPLVRPGFRRQG